MRSSAKELRKIGLVLILILVVSPLFYPSSGAIAGNGRGQRVLTYSVYPSLQEVNLNQSVGLIVSISGGQSYSLYGFNVVVTKPDQASNAIVIDTLTTDGNGFATGAIYYPSGFIKANAAPATNQTGTYFVRIDQSAPRYQYGVASSSFGVTSKLLLNILAPSVGTVVAKGTNLSLVVLVSDFNHNSYPNVSVSASLPGQQGNLTIPQGQSSGAFAVSYIVKWTDPNGLWKIDYLAIDHWGNRGVGSISVNITAAELSIQALNVFDASGRSRSTFYNNDTVSFRLNADYADGSRITSGAASIEILDPTGQVTVTLAMVYEPQLNSFETLSGFQFNETSRLGTWTARVSANGLGDGFGNSGPIRAAYIQFNLATAPTSYGNSQNPSQKFETSSFLPIALLSGSLAAVPIAVWKRRELTRKEDDLDSLIREANSTDLTLIEGEKQTGKSSAVYLIAGRTAQDGGNSILLTFENAPTDVRARMLQLDIPTSELEEKGNLQILDCSNVSESLNLHFIRSKLLCALDGKNHSTSVFIDSLNLLLDELEEKEIQDLLLGLGAEVKAQNGVLYATLTLGNFSLTTLTNLENISGLVLQAEKCSQNTVPSAKLKVMKVANGSILTLGGSLLLGGTGVLTQA